MVFRISGAFSNNVIPVPIPNTEVKLISADGTARVTVWESKSSLSLNTFLFLYQIKMPLTSHIFQLPHKKSSQLNK